MAGMSFRTFPPGNPVRGGADPSAAPSRLPSRHFDQAARKDEPRSSRLDENSIDRSLKAVERAVENLALLQENCGYYRDLASELRKALDDEREHAKVFAQQLADADRSRRADRERADRAERRLEQAGQTIRDMEREIAAMRARADRLAQTVDRLAPSDRTRLIGGIDDDLADLLAA